MIYFWKANGPRTSKMIFWTVKYTKTQMKIHKYTNTTTQIHKYGLWQSASTQHMLYFCTADDWRKSKIIFPSVHKYRNTDKNTNTQVQPFLSIQLKNANKQLTNWLLHGPPRFISFVFWGVILSRRFCIFSALIRCVC